MHAGGTGEGELMRDNGEIRKKEEKNKYDGKEGEATRVNVTRERLVTSLQEESMRLRKRQSDLCSCLNLFCSTLSHFYRPIR